MVIIMKKGIHSIKTQMLVTILLMICILTVGILVTTNIILSKNYEEEINFNNETVTNLIASNLQSFLGKAYSITEELTNSADIYNMNPVVQEQVLINCAKRNEFIKLLFIQGADGMQIARSSGECGDRADRWWFPLVAEEGKSFISKSYISASDNTAVSSIFAPIKKDDKIVGSIGMDIQLDYMQELIESNSDEKSGRYSFVMDGEGVIVAHPQKEYVTQMYNFKTGTKNADGTEQQLKVSESYKKITSEVMNGSSGSLHFKEEYDNYYCAYTPLLLPGDSDSWSIVTIQDSKAAQATINTIIRTSSLVGIVLMLFSAIIIFIIANRIANPIKKISLLLSQAASGDFTVKFQTRSKSELGLLANSFNEMLQKVSLLLSDAKQITENINTSMILLNDKSENVNDMAKNIKMSSHEILVGATDQAKDAEKSAEMSTKLDSQFKKLSDKTTEMVIESKKAADVTTVGTRTVEELKGKNQTTYDSIEKTALIIENLNQKSETIGSILKSLEDITSQTNLLSLNASIEAARAGEHGRGFAVVAQEIQTLSVESAEATKNINTIIGEIQNDITSSVQMMEEIKKVSKEQSDTVNHVRQVFNQISDATNEITGFVEENEKMVLEMQKNNNEVVEAIANIASISEETAACTETVSNSIQAQTVEIHDIAIQVSELKEKSKKLEHEIQKFKITT